VQGLIAGHGLRYTIATHSRGSENSLAILAGGKEFTPEEISAKILAKIKMDAEKVLGDEVDSAVITVPAYFNDKQKHGTRTAAALAGLKVRRLLPEPTAAAISFGVDTISGDEGRTILVFDFGGGTLDLSILTISGGQIIEMGKGGDMWLGGDDIDNLIIDHVLAETMREEEINDIRALIDQQDISRKNRFLAELKTAVEKAKIALSDETETVIEILGILLDEDGDAFDIEVELSREQFNTMLAPMLASMILLVRDTISNVHFTNDLIDNVLLVGGSSRIPGVIKAMQQEFGQEKVLLHDRPMLAIAEGAAILSHRLASVLECPGCGKEVSQSKAVCPHCSFDIDALTVDQGLVEIVHAAAHDYFIKLENNKRFLLVEKNTPLPCSSTEVFQLVHAEQELVHMKFYNVVNDKEESIGDLWLGIDSREESEETDKPVQIEITLVIDENNLVSANVALLDQPDIAISRTLSRGKADEKLFLSLEQTINEANQQGYTEFVVIDLLRRARSIIRTIHGVVNTKTGEVNETIYKQAQNKIAKAVRIADDGDAPRTKIYYAESMLSGLGMLIEPGLQKRIHKKIERLRKVDDDGSYEVTMKAQQELSDILDERGLEAPHLLMQIEQAGEICSKTDPAKSVKFMSAVEKLINLISRGNDLSAVDKLLHETMPEVHEVLDKHAWSVQKIHKDLRK
ncbi:MAG: Hsp70 family protein, partial [Desulfobulbaceae bacterium]|nr:Hsp70 family protein [Desulfobulbaceae bacterium]